MRFIATLVVLLIAPVQAQENTKPEPNIVLMPAVRTTATVSGDEYRVAKDENNKFVFIAPTETKTVKPLLIKIEIEKP